MSLRFSAAHSSRIKKSSGPPSLRRAASSPFGNNVQKRKSSTPALKRSKTTPQNDDDPLPDIGLAHILATDLNLRDVAQAIPAIRVRMFAPVPAERSGMNSTRIAEVLNFRRTMPQIVTVSHVHALLRSPTSVEREIDELIRAGVVRKIVVPGRGGMGEGLMLVKEMEDMLARSNMTDAVKAKFLAVLRANPASLVLGRGALMAEEAKALMQAGFITTATPAWTTGDPFFTRPGDASRGTATSVAAVARAASGSLAAVGGYGAVHEAGGSGGGIGTSGFGDFNVAIPSTGSFLKLLTAAKQHLVSLLGRSQFKEGPVNILKERWDGGIDKEDDKASDARRMRGDFTGVLPGRTRKWKQFYGMTFEWVLEECVGAGLLEVFETGSVGRAVRVI